MEIKIKNIRDNCIVILHGDVAYVTSYDSVILKVDRDNVLEVGEDWDYSGSTTRHLNSALSWLGNHFGNEIYHELSTEPKYRKIKYFEELGLEF